MSQWKWNRFKGYNKLKRLIKACKRPQQQKKIRPCVGLASFVSFLRLVFNAASFMCIFNIYST